MPNPTSLRLNEKFLAELDRRQDDEARGRGYIVKRDLGRYWGLLKYERAQLSTLLSPGQLLACYDALSTNWYGTQQDVERIPADVAGYRAVHGLPVQPLLKLLSSLSLSQLWALADAVEQLRSPVAPDQDQPLLTRLKALGLIQK